jgi:hypothetical protein
MLLIECCRYVQVAMSLSQRRVLSTRSVKWEAVRIRSARKYVYLQRRNSLIYRNPLIATFVGSCNWTGAPFETVEQHGGDDLNTFLGVFAKLRKASILASSCLSVRPLSTWNNSAPTGQIFMKFDIWAFFEYLSRKFKFRQNLTRITLLYVKTSIHFGSYPDQFFLEWESFQTNFVEKIKDTHFIFNTFFPSIIVPFMRC